ncbi:uncharacterized protein AB675_7851 [Cyphellophora attinorum]|uniref:Uncharacterized protein n=1 Tax=Cyphellophora attinorum TaxID=1664694 RepID=A0A0N1HBZ5_9EURO|nr:uncharacterized protein AB675_7851 [Phialophora attinorum]KPI41090.1 hypothetical protein AB675_7851 [Phialophora attinorum]
MESLSKVQDDQDLVDFLGAEFDLLLTTDAQCRPKTKEILQHYGLQYWLDAHDLMVHPSIVPVLRGEVFPSFEYITELPSLLAIGEEFLKAHFVVYVACFEKEGETDFINVGSAANQDSGALRRMQDYVRGGSMSQHTKPLLEKGWELTHIGLLMAIAAPMAKRNAPLRCFTLSQEAMFTFKLWSLYMGVKWSGAEDFSHYMLHAFPWEDPRLLDYSGVNSHSPLRDPVRGIDLPLNEILVQADVPHLCLTNRLAASREALNAYKRGELDESDPALQAKIYLWKTKLENSRRYIHSVKGKATLKAYYLREEVRKRIRAFQSTPVQLAKKRAYWHNNKESESARKTRENQSDDPAVQKGLKRAQAAVESALSQNEKLKQGRAWLNASNDGTLSKEMMAKPEVQAAMQSASKQRARKKKSTFGEKLKQGRAWLNASDAGTLSKEMMAKPEVQAAMQSARKEREAAKRNRSKAAAKKRAAKPSDEDDDETDSE